MLAAPERLPEPIRALLVAEENELFLSAASSWEIAIKFSIGRLRLPAPPSEIIPDLLGRTRTSSLPIQHSHALRVADLPPHHSDSFDRLLVAQAQVENMPIVTSDRQVAAYDVEILWA